MVDGDFGTVRDTDGGLTQAAILEDIVRSFGGVREVFVQGLISKRHIAYKASVNLPARLFSGPDGTIAG